MNESSSPSSNITYQNYHFPFINTASDFIIFKRSFQNSLAGQAGGSGGLQACLPGLSLPGEVRLWDPLMTVHPSGRWPKEPPNTKKIKEDGIRKQAS